MLNSTYTAIIFIDALDAIGTKRLDTDKSSDEGATEERRPSPRIIILGGGQMGAQ